MDRIDPIGENVPAVEQRIIDWKKMLNNANEAIKRAQAKQSKEANRKRRDLNFRVGDKVRLSTENLRIAGLKSKKLGPKYVGPFLVKKRIGRNAYKLQLPSEWRIHPVFNVGLLEPYVEREGGTSTLRSEELQLEEDAPEYEVEQILDKKYIFKGRGDAKRRIVRYLVKWKGVPDEESTWEPIAHLTGCKDLIREFEIQQPPERGAV